MELRYENGVARNDWWYDRLNNLWKEFEPAPKHMLPAADVVEDKDAYHFYFEIPGLKSESLDVRVEDDALVVAAERNRPQWPKENRVHVAERGYGRIRRAFELPEDANRDHVKASYKDGVLEVTIEKRAEAKPVKIQVN
jgi:HSP20 family protein